MQVSFTVMQTLSRRFLLVPSLSDKACAQTALCLLGRSGGVRGDGVIFYECERLENGASLFGASEYTAMGERVPLSADGARVLGAFLHRSDKELPPTLRILSEGTIRCVTQKEGAQDTLWSVNLPAPTFDPKRVGLRDKTPLLGQRVPVGQSALPFYALALDAPYTVTFQFGVPLFDLRPASIALPLSVSGLLTRPFCTVFAEVTGDESLSLRLFDPELGELDASSDGAAAATAAAHLLGLLPIACDLRAKMRGGTLFVRADCLGAPMTVTADVRHCFDGRTEI